MDTVCVVSMGYNQIKSWLGVFATVELAKAELLNLSCIIKEHDGKEYIVITLEFAEWLMENAWQCKGIYSVGGPVIGDIGWLMFDTIPLNKIIRGYDDD